MISADTGGSPKVAGNSIAIVRRHAEAGQHADGGAEKDADEAIGQIGQRQRRREAEREIGENVHGVRPIATTAP